MSPPDQSTPKGTAMVVSVTLIATPSSAAGQVLLFVTATRSISGAELSVVKRADQLEELRIMSRLSPAEKATSLQLS
jgi:hypothetical protein